MPTILGDDAKAANATPTVQINQEDLIAILLPQLSAKYGIVKNPRRLPTNIIDVNTVVIPLSSHIKYVG
jgi:hypothetical protein